MNLYLGNNKMKNWNLKIKWAINYGVLTGQYFWREEQY
jgi:hypothetical protein